MWCVVPRPNIKTPYTFSCHKEELSSNLPAELLFMFLWGNVSVWNGLKTTTTTTTTATTTAAAAAATTTTTTTTATATVLAGPIRLFLPNLGVKNHASPLPPTNMEADNPAVFKKIFPEPFSGIYF